MRSDSDPAARTLELVSDGRSRFGFIKPGGSVMNIL